MRISFPLGFYFQKLLFQLIIWVLVNLEIVHYLYYKYFQYFDEELFQNFILVFIKKFYVFI